MRKGRGTPVVALLAIVLLAATGCVSKSLFRDNIEDTDTRLSSVENAMEDNERRITDLKKETDQRLGTVEGNVSTAMKTGKEAMSMAEAADRAAQGKLLWSVTLTDDQVKFPFGKAELTSDAMGVLDRLVGKVKGSGKALYLEIEGHTDNVGSETLNHELGDKRAMAVRNYLNEKGGVPLHAMNTISYGESRPIADNSSRDGRNQNRRVVVRVLE